MHHHDDDDDDDIQKIGNERTEQQTAKIRGSKDLCTVLGVGKVQL